MIAIQLTTPLSKDFFEAVSLRKQTGQKKINYLKEQKFIIFVARYDNHVIGTASLQLYTNSFARIRHIAVAPDFENKQIETRLIHFVEDFLKARNNGGKVLLLGKKFALAATS